MQGASTCRARFGSTDSACVLCVSCAECVFLCLCVMCASVCVCVVRLYVFYTIGWLAAVLTDPTSSATNSQFVTRRSSERMQRVTDSAGAQARALIDGTVKEMLKELGIVAAPQAAASSSAPTRRSSTGDGNECVQLSLDCKRAEFFLF